MWIGFLLFYLWWVFWSDSNAFEAPCNYFNCTLFIWLFSNWRIFIITHYYVDCKRWVSLNWTSAIKMRFRIMCLVTDGRFINFACKRNYDPGVSCCGSDVVWLRYFNTSYIVHKMIYRSLTSSVLTFLTNRFRALSWMPLPSSPLTPTTGHEAGTREIEDHRPSTLKGG